MDNRKPWEVEYCLRVKFAASYLHAMNATGQRRVLLETAYGSDLDGFCRRQIKEIMAKCEKLVDDNGPLSTAALTVAQPSLELVRHNIALTGYPRNGII